MRRPVEFKTAFAKGRRFNTEFFSVSVRPNELTWARLGMSVAARTMRRAVDRNRVRRLIRESFRVHQHGLPAVDIVVGTRPPLKAAERACIRTALDQLWKKIAVSCANSSKS
jgi:ribonuclease P protein component